jgi:hypothetical protein
VDNPNLYDRTIDLLRNRGDITLREIASGARVEYEWLSKLSQGVIAEPGVNKVQRVHDFLSRTIN